MEHERRFGAKLYRQVSLWAVLVLAGCSDPFAGLLLPVPDDPQEVTLADFRTAPLQKEAAFDMINRITARVDQTASWDFLYYVDQSGQPQLWPFGALADDPTDSALQAVEGTFESVTRVPATGYSNSEPVDIAVGDVLAARSRRDQSFGTQCRHFAKLEILAIDTDRRTMTFRILINPNCEFLTIVPGETGRP
ncbi:MAG: hypothetical protein ACE5HQ_06325 [Gemmatimonadota bacterium]